MKTRILLLATLSLVQICAFGQIRIQNYKLNEMNNWSSQVQLNNRDLQRLQAGVQSFDDFSMDVKVLINVEATSYAAIFSVRQVAETAEEVNTLMGARLKSFKESLSGIGIDPTGVVVEIISQSPIYGLETEKKFFSKTQNEVPLGFELHKTITIPYKYQDQLNDIVLEASKNEIYDLVKVDYFAESPQLYFDTMRHAANSYMKAVYAQYKKAGFELDSFRKMMAESTTTIYPISRYRQYHSVSRVSYDKLLQKAGSMVTMNPITSPSLYYDFMPFSEFDIVLNPKISKPSIQYTFNLTVRYQREEKPQVVVEKKVEKQFFHISESGEVKFIDLK